MMDFQMVKVTTLTSIFLLAIMWMGRKGDP